jgi:hypothetical protein
VPAGTSLKKVGSITLSTPGQVVSGLEVTGTVSITASRVTFKNSVVHGSISVAYGSQTGVLIDHVEVIGDGRNPGITGAGFTVNAANIHGTGDGIDVENNDAVTNSYIHDLVVPSGAHVDGIQSAGGNALLISHNTIDASCAGCNSAVIIGADLGPFTGLQSLSDNLFAGGGYTAYAGTGGFAATNMIAFTNNRFVNDAGYGPCSFNVQVTFTGNVWDNTGSTLACSAH